MRVGEFSDSFLPVVDGVGRVVYSYCDHLGRLGEECTAVVPMNDTGYRGSFPFEIIDFYSQKLPGGVRYRLGMPLLDEHYHQRIAMKHFELVHVHSPFIAGMEGVHYAKKNHVPLIGTFHSRYYDDFLQISGSRLVAGVSTDILVRDFFNRCDEVWTLTEESERTLRNYGVTAHLWRMPNGIERRPVSRRSREISIRRYGIRTNCPVLLYVGQLNWKKNLAMIMEACAEMKKEGMDFQLVFAGMGPHETEIRQKAEALAIGEELNLVGHVQNTEELDGLYAAADLFVFPSVYDTYGLVVREAANAGTPSVVTEESGASDGIRNGINGFLARETSSDLCRVIVSALQDRDRLEKIGEAAMATLPVSWEEVIERVRERYRYHIERNRESLR